MGTHYRDALERPWLDGGRSLRPRDALKHIAAQLDSNETLQDLGEMHRRLHIIREKTDLGLACEHRLKRVYVKWKKRNSHGFVPPF
jgi:hypothetical protein